MKRMPEVLHDETGSPSSARVLLFVTSAVAFVLILATSFFHTTVPGEAWTLLTVMETSFTMWAAGPRIAAYLAPAAKATMQTLADAIRARRIPDEGYEPTP